jgi:glycine cleavage system transcriptional repressor
MPLFAVTVLGHDRPGIVAEVTEAVADLGGNLDDSSMTLLRGHFAMTLVAEVEAAAEAIGQRLDALSRSGLVVSVLAMPPAAAGTESARFLLSVHGGDRPGIVSAVTRRIADLGGNITDLSTRLAGSFYVLTAEVQLPVEQADAVTQALREVAAGLGVAVHLTPLQDDVL